MTDQTRECNEYSLTTLTGLTNGAAPPCTDRWTLTLADLPGVVHLCRDDPLPDPQSERDELLMSDMSTCEIAAVLGLTRQRVHQLRQRQAEATRPASISTASDSVPTV